MSNYVRQQFEKLDQSARFTIKVRGDLGETHWISVPPCTQLNTRPMNLSAAKGQITRHRNAVTDTAAVSDAAAAA